MRQGLSLSPTKFYAASCWHTQVLRPRKLYSSFSCFKYKDVPHRQVSGRQLHSELESNEQIPFPSLDFLIQGFLRGKTHWALPTLFTQWLQLQTLHLADSCIQSLTLLL